MGDDITVVNSARVSFSKRSEWVEEGEELTLKPEDEKLIKYLAEHNHWTPFSHPQITLRIKAPIPIRTQFFKHKQGFTENEQSRRYITTVPDTYLPKWRSAPQDDAKQGSSVPLDNEQDIQDCDALYLSQASSALRVYLRLMDDYGVAPEQARMVLPQGMLTEWYWTGSLAAYARFYNLRSSSDAQWEIQEYAKAIGGILNKLFPYSWPTLTDNNTAD